VHGLNVREISGALARCNTDKTPHARGDHSKLEKWRVFWLRKVTDEEYVSFIEIVIKVSIDVN